VDEGERVCQNLGRRVIELRKAQGLTQQNLADRMQIDARDVRRIESGDNVTVVTLVKLAGALDVDIGALFEPAAQAGQRRPGRPRSPR
jgi:transcriptional regulator with XRE-family HTH domain